MNEETLRLAIEKIMALRDSWPDPLLRKAENLALSRAMLAIVAVYILEPGANLDLATDLIYQINEMRP